MLETRIVYLNGDFVPESRAMLPIMSHSLGRGAAIFDVLSFTETVGGIVIFRLDEHVARFARSAVALGMALPLSNAEIMEIVRETVRRNSLKTGAIKITGFHPEPSFSLMPPETPLDIAVFVFDPVDDFGEKPPSVNDTVTAFVSHWRRLDPLTVPGEAKVAANYLNGIMARTEAKNFGFDYAMMLDSEGNLAEGGTESIFLVREKCLMTPNIGHILQGITRKSIFPVANALGIKTFAGPLKEELLNEADEIFFSGTIHRVLPVSRVGSRIIPEAPGPISRVISETMAEIVSGRDSRFTDWLFPV